MNNNFLKNYLLKDFITIFQAYITFRLNESTFTNRIFSLCFVKDIFVLRQTINIIH